MTPTLRSFTETSTDLYERHHYLINLNDDRQLIVDSFGLARAAWYELRPTKPIEVIDIPPTTSGTGFG